MRAMLRDKRFLFLFSVTLLIRLALLIEVQVSDPELHMLHDSYGYASIGENFFEHGVWSQSEEVPFYPDVFRTPVYPLLIGTIVQLGGDLLVLMLVQMLVSLLTLYFILRAVELLSNGNTKVMLIIGWLYALDVPSIVMGNLVMTENVFAMLMAGVVWMFVAAQCRGENGNENGNGNGNGKEDVGRLPYPIHRPVPNKAPGLPFTVHRSLLYAGIFLGLAILTRPVALYLPLVLIPFLLWKFRKQALWLVVPVVVLSGSWYARNYAVHRQVFYSEIGNFNLLYFQAADLFAKENGLSLDQARAHLYEQVQNEMEVIPREDPVLFYERCGRKAKRIIATQPGGFLKNALKAHGNLFFRPLRGYLDYQLGVADVYSANSPYGRTSFLGLFAEGSHWFTFLTIPLQLLINLVVFVALLISLFRMFRKERTLFWLALILIGYFVLVCSGPEIDARFRVAVLPLLLAFTTRGFFYRKGREGINREGR
ncbi:MAG: hypothetical protein ACK40M_02945 [Flavobacteriales bacterium]